MFDDPELVFGVVDEGDGGFGSGGDGVVCALEIDGVVIVDAALLAEGKVQVEKGRRRHWADALGAGRDGVLPDGERDAPGAALAGAILTLEFHLENLVGVLRSGDFCVRKEGNKASLEGAETTFDFAFCLRSGRDEMGDAEAAQSALELAFWVGAVAAGAGTKKAERIGINSLGDAVVFKGAAEVAKVIPRGVCDDETRSDIEPGMIVHREQENLLVRGRPPLMDGAVVLPKFADMSPAKTPVGANARRRNREQMREVFFEISLNAGTSADEAVKPLEFIGHELEIGRTREGQKLLQKSDDVARPERTMRATARLWAKGALPSEPGGTEFVETRLCDPELRGGGGSINGGIVKSRENPADKLRRQAMDKLLFSSRHDAPKAVRTRREKHQSGSGPPHRRPPLRSVRRCGGPLPPKSHSTFVPSPFRFCSGPDSISLLGAIEFPGN